MATSMGQRIGIWVIAGALTIGTLGGFVAMILSTDNSKKDQELATQQQADAQKKVDAASKILSDKYYASFKAYKDSVVSFDPSTVGDKVTTNDLVVGDGTDIAKDTKYQVYYIGWNPKGVIFDSSLDTDKLKAPLDTSTLQGGLIAGWDEGVIGMKVGGVREITIPSDKAYGEKGAGDSIPPNTPIKFIVQIIATT